MIVDIEDKKDFYIIGMFNKVNILLILILVIIGIIKEFCVK